MTLVFLATIACGILHGSLFEEDSVVLWEITLIAATIGFFLIQILTLGSKINKRCIVFELKFFNEFRIMKLKNPNFIFYAKV